MLLLCVQTNGILMLQCLRTHDQLQLAATSKQIFSYVSPFINDSHYFHIYPEVDQLQYYHPHKLILYNNINWDTFKQITHIRFPPECKFMEISKYFPSSITHIIDESRNRYYSSLPHQLISLIISAPSSCTSLPYLPATLKHLNTKNSNVQVIPVFPPSMETLELNYSSILNLASLLPRTLTRLSLPDYFNQNIDDLPHSLLYLHLGSHFILPINKFPPLLEELITSPNFDNPIDHLPSSLQQLTLGRRFSCSLNNLPDSLTHLLFNSTTSYYNALPALPPQLRVLQCHGKDLLDVQSFPASLECLKIRDCLTGPTIPSSVSLEMRTLIESLDSLPHNSVTLITLGAKRNVFKDESFQQFSSLTSLHLHEEFNQPLFLPRSLKYLWTGHDFNQPINLQSTALEELYFTPMSKFNHPVDLLPPTLRILHILGPSFNHPVDNLPSNLQELSLGRKFNQPIEDLPVSLKKLSLQQGFGDLLVLVPSLHTLELNANVPLEYLPPLVKLVLGSHFNHEFAHLPSTLRSLTLSSKWRGKQDQLPHSLVALNWT